MPIRFCPAASGSNGNCSYFSTGKTTILIDAGLSGVRIEARLNSVGASAAEVGAIFVTHEHSDHVAGVGVLSRRFDIPVYATAGTWAAMERDRAVGRVAPKNRRLIYNEENVLFNDLVLRPFAIPHDAAEPVGYAVSAQGAKVVVATDIGCVTGAVRENILGADIILLESNHDEEMVKNGRYPEALKSRILGSKGHLSNTNCGKLLAEVISDRVKHVYLGHLSDENNNPGLAYETVRAILSAARTGVNESFRLRLTDRSAAGEMVFL